MVTNRSEQAKAETIVLEANGKGNLLTVALRPAGIFGCVSSSFLCRSSLICSNDSPGDRQALPGFLDVLKTGRTKFQIGSNQNLFDWTYVDNVVHAHIVAAERLEEVVTYAELDTRLPPVDKDIPRRNLPTSTYRPDSLIKSELSFNPLFINTSSPDEPLRAARNRYDQWFTRQQSTDNHDEAIPVAGQAFFITNGEPIAFWDFPRAIWAAYNGHVPSYIIAIPAEIGLTLAGLGETFGWLTGREVKLTRGKVVYSTVNRYYNIEKVGRSSFVLMLLILIQPSTGTTSTSIRTGSRATRRY